MYRLNVYFYAEFFSSDIETSLCWHCCDADPALSIEAPHPEDPTRTKLYRLKLEKAEEPSNVAYENLKYSSANRLWRRAITVFATLLIMCVSFALIFLATFYRNQIPTAQVCFVTPTRAQAAAAGASSTTVNCYCRSLSLSAAINEKPLCTQYLIDESRSQGLIALAALTVVIINYCLRSVISFLVTQEKRVSLTEQQGSVMWKLFICLFLNTTVIIVATNFDYTVFSSTALTIGKFSSLTSDWYEVVGTGVIYTLLINTINPHIVPVIIEWPLHRCRVWRKSDSLVATGTQTELNELYGGSVFSLAERYAVIMNTFFSTLFFSAGIPLLTVAAFGSFFFTYWFDRISLLRLYARPPAYGPSIASLAVSMMPYAVFIHLLVGAFMFGSVQIWGLNYADVTWVSTYVASTQASLARQYVWSEAIFQRQALPLFVFAFALLGFKILHSLRHFSPVTINVQIDALAEEEFQKKLPRLSLVIASKLHLIDSYHCSQRPQYQSAFKQPNMKAAIAEGRLRLGADLPEVEPALERRSEAAKNAALAAAGKKAAADARANFAQAALVVGKTHIVTGDESGHITEILPPGPEVSRELEATVQIMAVTCPGPLAACQECMDMVPALVYCRDCDRDLCAAHRQLHRYVRTMRTHEMVPISQVASLVERPSKKKEKLRKAAAAEVAAMLEEERRKLQQQQMQQQQYQAAAAPVQVQVHAAAPAPAPAPVQAVKFAAPHDLDDVKVDHDHDEEDIDPELEMQQLRIASVKRQAHAEEMQRAHHEEKLKQEQQQQQREVAVAALQSNNPLFASRPSSLPPTI
jgi:hypothetical protein